MKKRTDCQKGFSLIELILYIGIVNIFIGGAILFAWNIIYSRVRSQTQREVAQNILLVSNRLSYEIRNAVGINSIGPEYLSLQEEDPARDPTVFDLDSGRLRIGIGVSGNCPISNPCNLTSNLVSVTDLNFTDLSQLPQSKNVSFSVTIASISDRSEWQIEQSYERDSEKRSDSAGPTPTPTPPIPTSCDEYCTQNGYAGGICRQNVSQCNNNGETYQSGGDIYCTGGPSQDTCCCQ